MHQRLAGFTYVSLVLFMWLVLPGAVAVCGTQAEIGDFNESGFSIGINDLPWEDFNVSFRWWGSGRSGRELEIRNIYISSLDYGHGVSDANNKEVNISRVRFDFLRRRPTSFGRRFFIVNGFGVGARFHGKWSTDERYTFGSSKRKLIETELFCFIPFGVEHFFWRRFPYLSYSLQADFYLSGTYTYEYYSTSSENVYECSENSGYSFIVGIDPRFYFRVYF